LLNARRENVIPLNFGRRDPSRHSVHQGSQRVLEEKTLSNSAPRRTYL
jgi:hypothetical protein